MNSTKTKPTKLGSGESRMEFCIPKDPFEIHIFEAVPPDARITSMVIRYVRLPREVIDAARKKVHAKLEAEIKRQKRHEAAIKANATRKANKKKKEVAR